MRETATLTVFDPSLTRLEGALRRVLPTGWTVEPHRGCDENDMLVIMDADGSLEVSYAVACQGDGYEVSTVTEAGIHGASASLSIAETVFLLRARIATLTGGLRQVA